jgi:sigma-E factor negative regulatory protein RseA
MVMNEKISRLMDGELEQAELDAVCAGLKKADAMVTWTCYHVIGDMLRGSGGSPCGVHARFVERLEAEPTVLAPQRRTSPGVATWAWAAAATVAAVTVVGWTALSVVGDVPVVAKAREATTVTAARMRPSNVPADYLIAHQEYSPAAAIQGVGPYLRAVATAAGDRP